MAQGPHHVEFRITDPEPFCQLTSAAAAACAAYKGLRRAQRDNLPAALTAAYLDILTALAALGAEWDDTPQQDPAARGSVILEWPPPAPDPSICPEHGLPARLTAAWEIQADGTTRLLPFTDLTLRVTAEQDTVTAELTVPALADGEPAYDGIPAFRDGQLVTATHLYRVAGMRVRESP